MLIVIATVQQNEVYQTFEHMISTITIEKKSVGIFVIYWPPNTSLSSFLQEFSNLLGILTASDVPSLICGDFNIHVDAINCNATIISNILISQSTTEDIFWICF